MVTEGKKKSKLVKTKLDKLQKETADLKKKKPQGDNEVMMRTQQEQHIIRQLVALIQRYGKIQEEFEDDVKRRIQRQAKLSGDNLSDEEVEQMVKQAEVC